MNFIVGLSCRPARRSACQIFHITWAGALIAMLIATTCLPATAAQPRLGSALKAAESNRPVPVTASAKRFARNAFAGLPLGFEARATGPTGQFSARTDKWNVYLTGTEAALTWRSNVGVGPLGRSAYLGLPRNAGSLQANEQLPEPRCDRVAPRDRRTSTSEAPTATLRMQMIGANPCAHLVGDNQLPTQTDQSSGFSSLVKRETCDACGPCRMN